MNELDAQLVQEAKAVLGEFHLREDFSAGSVGAAIRTAQGRVYTGICIDLGCGLGFCAEVAAIAEMLKHRETRISSVVAVSRWGVIAPCGRCRETMVQVDSGNLDARVILGNGKAALLRELLPEDWMTRDERTRTGADGV